MTKAVEGGRSISKEENMETSSTKPTVKNVQVFDSEEAVAVSLAKYIADISEKFVREKGSFSIVLSGGDMIRLMGKLVEEPYVGSLDWSKWHVYWLDERFVPKNHPDSNYKLAYDGFLSKVPILPAHVYSINDTVLSVEAAADDYESQLKHLVQHKVLHLSAKTGFPKFDLNLVGMGPCGHVASLFPGHPLLHEKKRWVTFIKDSPKPPPQRITLTFPVINSSQYIALVVVGKAQAEAVGIALRGSVGGSDLLPVQMVSAQEELAWFLDKDAASKLE